MPSDAELARELVLIWSGEHSAYWGPDNRGYASRDFAQHAGVYERGEAESVTAHCGPEKKIKIVPLADAPSLQCRKGSLGALYREAVLSASRAEGAAEEREQRQKQAERWRCLLLDVQAYGFVGGSFRTLLKELDLAAALAPPEEG